MKLKYKITAIILTVLFIKSDVFSQNNTNTKGELSFGIGLSQSDRRFDFLIKDGGWGTLAKVAAADKPWFEYDFFINYNRAIINRRNFELTLGTGYLLNINLFRLKVNNSHFKISEKILMTNEIYYKNNISIPVEVKYKIFESPKRRIQFLLGVNNNFTFYKSLVPENRGIISVFQLGFSDVELYSGFRYDTNTVGYSLQYRLINLQFRDDALANNEKEIDLYNPVKFRLAISKKLN